MRVMTAMAGLLLIGGCSDLVQARRERAPAEGFFQNGDIKLAYRLDRPDGPGPFPAVVIGHGSGLITRAYNEHLARPLVARGYAALTFDKRGVGESTGVYSGVGVVNGDRMFDLLASDMAAGVAFLRRQPEIDARRIGLMGASQAGWIIPLAAKRTPVAFMILLSGPTVSIGEENYYSDFAETGGTTLERAYDELTRFKGPRGFDPVPTLETLDTPGLWLLGQADESIPERNTAAILRGLAAKGRSFTVVEYPGANHGLFNPTTGARAPIWPEIERFLAGIGK